MQKDRIAQGFAEHLRKESAADSPLFLQTKSTSQE